MKTLKIFNWYGTCICSVRLEISRWEISGGYFSVFDINNNVVFKHVFTTDFSWRVE